MKIKTTAPILEDDLQSKTEFPTGKAACEDSRRFILSEVIAWLKRRGGRS